MNQKLAAFERLLGIMDELREQCPWDKKQTIASLSYLTIEETYELVDAIAAQDMAEIKKELGDLMLHIVFYARIASETNSFDIADVLHAICDKLIVRHPHIYGDVKAETEEEVKRNWEQIKLKEGNRSVLSGVPKSLPALIKAQRIQEKARGVGFDWEAPHQVWDKVQEELQELKAAIEEGGEKPQETQQAHIEAEFGDLLFALINYGRFIGVDPESALTRTNQKFIRRFQYLEQKAEANGQSLSDMTLAQMDVFWEEAKKME
jgi:XTP/dITP diphosphohydrolase